MSTLMIQGTTSDAGKSALVTGLCRLLKRRHISVAPFKPQNMALNSAVTIDGGEIGRAQALQALAAGIEPHSDMNPILLKPNSDTGSQIIVQGHALGNMDAHAYHEYKSIARHSVMDSYNRLRSQYDVILVEGAGSPAEINLRDNDIANMGFAEAIDCPVLLVADIDRGGVFAHLVGTLELLNPSERNRIMGLIINRFRGEINLLQPGIDWLEETTNKTVIGVLPFITNLHLEAEDSLSIKNSVATPALTLDNQRQSQLKIIVPRLPRISNHTDFDPLRLHPQVDLQFIHENEEIPSADLIILPGSKSVAHDLLWLKKTGWQQVINRHLRYGGKLIGICGGFQMLGQKIFDPQSVETDNKETSGFGLLNMTTTLKNKKQLRNIRGFLSLDDSPVSGYEIHAGITTGPALSRPTLILDGQPDGAISGDGQIIGTYLHGLFESSESCKTLLRWAGLNESISFDYRKRREADIDRLADTIEHYLDINAIDKLLKLNNISNPLSLRERAGVRGRL